MASVRLNPWALGAASLAALGLSLACSDEGDTVIVVSGSAATGGGSGTGSSNGGTSAGSSAEGGSSAGRGAGANAGSAGNSSSGGSAAGNDDGGSPGAGGGPEGGAAGTGGGTAGGGSGTGGATPGSCQGTAAPCDELAGAQCAQQEGCTDAPRCNGDAWDCTDYGRTYGQPDPEGCETHPNCSWSNGACVGEAPPECGDRDSTSCTTAGGGCFWEEYCPGFAVACSSILLEAPCRNQLGCVWQ